MGDDENIQLDPVTELDNKVFAEIQETMGEGREATTYLEWVRHSRRFIEEEAFLYDPKYVYEARAKYVKYCFHAELEKWPYH